MVTAKAPKNATQREKARGFSHDVEARVQSFSAGSSG
jgi:hypothetical protein